MNPKDLFQIFIDQGRIYDQYLEDHPEATTIEEFVEWRREKELSAQRTAENTYAQWKLGKMQEDPFVSDEYIHTEGIKVVSQRAVSALVNDEGIKRYIGRGNKEVGTWDGAEEARHYLQKKCLGDIYNMFEVIALAGEDPLPEAQALTSEIMRVYHTVVAKHLEPKETA